MVDAGEDARVHALRAPATYRVHLLDQSRRIERPTLVFEAADDFTAVARARALVGDQRHIEIWQGSRLVGPTSGPGGETKVYVDLAAGGDQ
jgi:hypothetical protein